MAYDGKPYGYRPGNTYSPVRDRTYPSEIARQRPALAARIHCTDYEAFDSQLTIRGDREPGTEDPRDRFNRQLRAGHGYDFRDNFTQDESE